MRRVGPAPAIRMSRHRLRGPYLKEVGANPGKLRIAWTAAAPNGAKVERGMPERARRDRQALRRSGPPRRGARPRDRSRGRGAHLPHARVGQHRREPREPPDCRTAGARGRSGANHLADREDGREDQRCRLRSRHPDGASAGSPDGSVPLAMGRAADAGAGHATREARLDRHDDGRRATSTGGACSRSRRSRSGSTSPASPR